jgi:hypothetical protein
MDQREERRIVRAFGGAEHLADALWPIMAGNVGFGRVRDGLFKTCNSIPCEFTELLTLRSVSPKPVVA